MKNNYLSYVLWAVILCFINACNHSAQVFEKNTDPRGEVISSVLLNSYTLEQCDSIILAKGIPAIFKAKSGIEIYRVSYKTIDWKNEATFATGALVIPTSNLPLDLASYQHGTAMKKKDVCSYEEGEVIVGIVMAAALGYLVQIPDYLGLGDSPGLHPYIHSKTEASAVIDMLRSTRHIMKEKELPLTEKLFLFGYSQGGHATMAAQKEIEENHADEFTITATAPLSGPYNVSGVQADVIIESEPYPAPGYLPYILFSYNQIYFLFEKPSDIFIEPYATTLPTMFDGLHGNGDLDNAMPPSQIPNDAIIPEVLEDFKTNLNHPLRKALRDNDLIEWKPLAPMQMCACTGDEHVSYENAMIAYYSFIQKGSTTVKPPLITQGFDHQSCAQNAMFQAAAFFDGFR